LIWTSLLLHGNGHNTSDRVQLCQYLTMNPTAQLTEENRKVRIQCWHTNTPPPTKSFPGEPRRTEEQRVAPAELTDGSYSASTPGADGDMWARMHGHSEVEAYLVQRGVNARARNNWGKPIG
jgi:hypothetical protein